MSDERASRLAALRSRVSEQLAAAEDAEEEMEEMEVLMEEMGFLLFQEQPSRPLLYSK